MKTLFSLLTFCALGAFAVGCAPKDAGTEPAPVTPAPEGGSALAPAAPEQPAEPAAGDADAELPPPATDPAPVAPETETP